MSSLADHIAQCRTEHLDDLLSRWHHWQISSRATTAVGYDSASAGAGLYLASRQYHTGEMFDDEVNSRECGAVEYAVQQISERDRVEGTSYGLALRVHARALYLGTSAMQSPRLPTRREEMDAVLETARAKLLARLISAGVIE